MRTVTLRRSLVALFAAAISFGAITQAQAETLRIGYQKYGTLVLLKAKGTLEKRLADKGIDAAGFRVVLDCLEENRPE